MNISGEEGFIMTMGSYLSLFLKIMIILRNKNFGALGNFAKGAIIGTGTAAGTAALAGGKYVYDSKNALDGNMGEENGAGY